jgi:YggT family protein
MFVAGNFINALAQVLDMILQIYMYIVIASALISWVNPDPRNPIVQFLHKATEPVLKPIRQHVKLPIAIDVSPIIALLAIMFLQRFLVASLVELAQRMN